MHSDIDANVERIRTNLVQFLKHANYSEVRRQTHNSTNYIADGKSAHDAQTNGLMLRVTADKFIDNCNSLLKMTNDWKKNLLLSDF
jgi:hypothetical protein